MRNMSGPGWRGRLLLLITVPVVGCAADGSRSMDAEVVTDPLAKLRWMVGSWGGSAPDGTWTEEHWTASKGGTMLGMSRTVKEDATGREKTLSFEFLRIRAEGDQVTYFAAPSGRSPPTPFRMVECDGGHVVFANPEHDFPTRIVYELSPNGTLCPRIEGTRNGNTASEGWKLAPMRP